MIILLIILIIIVSILVAPRYLHYKEREDNE